MLDIHQWIDYVSGLFLTIWTLFNALQSWQNVRIMSLHMRLSLFLILALKNGSCRMNLIFNLHMMYEKAIMIVFSLNHVWRNRRSKDITTGYWFIPADLSLNHVIALHINTDSIIWHFSVTFTGEVWVCFIIVRDVLVKWLALQLHVTEILVHKLSIKTSFPNWDILCSLLNHCRWVLELCLKIGPTTSICVLYRLPFHHYCITHAID